MPYNSSSFERQLAKYKRDQAEKAVATMQRGKPEPGNDPHKVKPHFSGDRGTIKSNAIPAVQIMGEGAQTAPVMREAPVLIPLIIKSRKPFYKRAWFIFLVVTTLPVLGAPILYKEEMKEFLGMAESIKTSTGVDPLSIKTYTNLIRGKTTTPEKAPVAAVEEASANKTAPIEVKKDDLAQPLEFDNAVEAAQDKAKSVTSQGSDYSMKYIEEETRRLHDAAKEFDAKYQK